MRRPPDTEPKSRSSWSAGSVILVAALGSFHALDAQQPPDPLLQSAPCSDVESVDGSLVFGLLHEADSGIPLPGGRVVMSWAGGGTANQRLEAAADVDGSYWFCDAPQGVEVTIRGTALGRSGPLERLRLSSGDRRRLDVGVFLTAPAQGALAGRLVDAGDGSPIEGAAVTLPDMGIDAVTGRDGGFRLADIPAGSHSAEVRHVGYGEQEVSLEAAAHQTTFVEVRVSPVPIALEPMTVLVEVRPQWLEEAGFYERRDRGLGQFITPDDLERQHLKSFSQIIENVHGLRLVRVCTPHCFYRVATTTSAGPCAPQFYVDGKKVWMPLLTDLNAIASAHDVAAVEVYRGASQIPAQFFGRCGSVVVWTWRVSN